MTMSTVNVILHSVYSATSSHKVIVIAVVVVSLSSPRGSLSLPPAYGRVSSKGDTLDPANEITREILDIRSLFIIIYFLLLRKLSTDYSTACERSSVA